MTEVVAVNLLTKEGRHWVRLLGGAPAGNDHVHRTVSGWPGWRRWTGISDLGGRRVSTFTAPAWPHCFLPLIHTTWRVDWEPYARAAADAAYRCLAAAENLLAGRDARTLRQGARRLMPHQTAAVAAATALGSRLLLTDDMGLGKTTTALSIAYDAACRRVLVLSPKTVKWNWRQEVWSTIDKSVACYVIDGGAKDRADTFAALEHCRRLASDNFAVAVINYDALRYLSEEQLGMLARWCDGEALLADESHYLKSPKADRTRITLDTLAPATGGPRVRIAISGTPVRNQVDDLFCQIELVRPGSFTSYSDFVRRYCVVMPMQFAGRRPVQVIRGAKNHDELQRVLSTMRIGRHKEDVLDLPPRTYTKPELQLEGKLLSIYKAMRDLAVLELQKLLTGGASDGGATSIFSPQARGGVEAALRCEQLAQGFVGGIPEHLLAKLAPMLSSLAEKIPGRPNELIFPSSPKLTWLLETIEEVTGAGRQVTVFSRFNGPIAWLLQKLEALQPAHLVGSLDGDRRNEEIERFRKGEARVMLAQVKIAEGYNLTTCNDVIFLGRDWSPAINSQAEARCHRIGTKGTVNIQLPIVVNTVEKLIDRKLSAKGADAEQALRAVSVQELLEAL